MLFHVNTILADFCWWFQVHDVQIVLLKHYSHYTVTQILANKIVITLSLVPVKYRINPTAAMGIFYGQ